MAGTKVTLRTAFNDEFVVGDVTITQEGTELPSRAKADEVLETARQHGVALYEVEPETDEVAGTPTKKTEGSAK